MDVMQACRCCLRCPPDKDLTTPYTHLGGTEIYADMVKQCFDIQLLVGEDGPRGICSACVGRLRDASDFKLQVQRSQAELQARLQEPTVHIKEEPVVKTETKDEDWTNPEPVFIAESLIKVEIAVDDETSHNLLAARAVKEEVSDAASDEDCPAPNLQQTSSKQQPNLLTTDKKFTCSQCQYTTNDEKLLRPHLKIHTANNNFKCSQCGFTSRYKSHIRRHQMIHTSEKPFECSYCNYKSSYKSHLRDHLMTHTGEKPYECNHCSFKCSVKSNLRQHLMIHSSEKKSFECIHCNYTSTVKSNLRRHLRTHR